MKFVFLGGAMEIGGSSILLRLDEKNILLDAGIRQNGAKDPLPDYRKAQELGGIDAFIISHAHMDHIGTLPLISKEYPMASVYMNRMTMDLTGVLLRDSLKIMSRWEEEIPHYAQKDVTSMMDRMTVVPYQTPYEILPGIKLTLYPAGHIAGASCIYLQGREGTVFYSGDFSGFSQRAIEGIRIPRLRPDVAIVESTYGDRLHSNRQAEENVLVETAAECIAKKGKMLIPAFALGRSQEVILILKSAMDRGVIPKAKVYVDGMVRDISTSFLLNPQFLKNAVGKKILRGNNPFFDDYITQVKPTDDRSKLLDTEDPVIIVSSSGMLTGGPSVQYAAQIAPMEQGYFVITGYQDEEAPGRRILEAMEEPQDGERSLLLGAVRVPVRCTIRKAGLSAHGDKSEIHALLERLGSRNIFLVHGDKEVIKSLGRELSQDYFGRIRIPDVGEEYVLDIRNKRKQQTGNLFYSMQKNSEYGEQDGKELWEYWMEHYEGRLFPLPDLFYIWSGKKGTGEEEEAQRFKAELLKSVQFELNPKRLYLFQAREQGAIDKDLCPKEKTMQELEAIVRELFGEYPFKKISYQFEKKQVRLNFDYPDAVPDTIKDGYRQFHERTGFAIAINKTMNLNKAGLLLRELFGTRFVKASYHAAGSFAEVSLSRPASDDPEKKKKFSEATGWKLLIGNENKEERRESAKEEAFSEGEEIRPPERSSQIEQNLALRLVEYEFEGQARQPYKKSIKTDGEGKYIELAFLSPEIGRSCEPVLRTISAQTGWRLRISKSVNQMEVLNITSLKLQERGMSILKGPSYKPLTQSVEARVRGNREKGEEACREVYEETGCKCSLIWD